MIQSTHPSAPASDLAELPIYPLVFSAGGGSNAADDYLADPPTRQLADFFEAKGLAAIKEEDRTEQWYGDWLEYQAKKRLYATVLAPARYITNGPGFDLLRFARLLEVFAYYSPGHGYSLQVTFLGLSAILMGNNESLKQEAVATIEAGGLLAFGISEKPHGADLLGNEFSVRESAPGRLVANGSKYYIGNSEVAAIIAVLARKEGTRSAAVSASDRVRRAPMVLLALRPAQSAGFRHVRKIRTLGVRAASVGEFEVTDQELPETDVIAEGRRAWDAVLGTVTLGKFFLGFGSMGICEHAMAEAAAHLGGRILFGKPAIEMPHIRAMMVRAFTRLTAMKLYAFRALDYVQAANPDDRRYLLFNAVQKAKVSTEGVKVMGALSECVGAKGFESDTYMEMALRDIQLIPGLEGSTHINLALAVQFMPQYFMKEHREVALPPSLLGGAAARGENPYLMQASTGAINSVGFRPFLEAYKSLRSIANVRLFAHQARIFRLFLKGARLLHSAEHDLETTMAVGRCFATVAYGQLVAEHAALLKVPAPIVSAVFHLLVEDLSAGALALASTPSIRRMGRVLARNMVTVPRTTQHEWDVVWRRLIRSHVTRGPSSTP